MDWAGHVAGAPGVRRKQPGSESPAGVSSPSRQPPQECADVRKVLDIPTLADSPIEIATEALSFLELAREHAADRAVSALLAHEAVRRQFSAQLDYVLRQPGQEGSCESRAEVKDLRLDDPAARCLYWLAFGRDPASADWWPEWQAEPDGAFVHLAERALNFLQRDLDKWHQQRASLNAPPLATE